MRLHAVRWLALSLALVGYWAPWLTHPAAALRLNGYELSEWVTFLPGVRDGTLPLSRLLFLLPLACLALLLGLAATRTPAAGFWSPLGGTASPPARSAPAGLAALLPPVSGWPGWLLLIVGLISAFVVFPPYPYLLTAYADPEYQAQLFVASATLVGLLFVGYLPGEAKDLLQIGLAVIAGALGAWALLALRPVASELLNASWPVGLGWPALLLGCAGLALAGIAQLFGPRA